MFPRPNSPADLGYRWPAEWEEHRATWLSWPHNRRTWPDAFEPIPGIFAEFVKTLARFEPVQINAGGDAVYAEAQALVGSVPNVTLHHFPTNDTWCRDHGPTFLQGRADLPPALVDWRYNAWGNKYPPFDKDDDIPRQIAEFRGYRRFEPGIVMEGGGIEGNGAGTILTTEQCLLNPNRNPQLSREQIEQSLADYLGALKVIWLTGGDLAGDDTDGHIDQLARFVNTNTVVCAVEKNPDDVNYAPTQTNLRELRAATLADGRAIDVVELPLPSPLYHDDDPELRMPGSYCNFHIANGVVIVPVFEDPNDAGALGILRSLFPDREVIGLPARQLVWGLGAYHCMSQQEPLPIVKVRQ